MSAQHTPGPWTTHQEGHNLAGWPIWTIFTSESALTKVYTFGEAANPGRAEANARLIAAAPDLLAECKRVLAILNQPWKDCDGPKTLQIAKADCSIARGYLESAISKAEGKA